MRRLLWLLLGTVVAVLLRRALARPDNEPAPMSVFASVGASLSELAAALATFVADVRSATAEREDQLRLDAGLPPRSAAATSAAARSAAATSAAARSAAARSVAARSRADGGLG